MAKVSFFLDTPKERESRIFLRFSTKGKRILVSTGEKVPVKYWNFESQRAKQTTAFPKNSTLNKFLNRIFNESDDLLLKYKQEKTQVTPSMLKRDVRSIIDEGGVDASSFFGAYTDFLDDKKKEVKELTIKKFNTLEKLLTSFQKKRNFPLDFGNLDIRFETKFRKFLEEEHEQLNDTIVKYIECLKTFLRWAQENDYPVNRAFERFSIKRPKDKRDIIVLNELELIGIYKADLSSDPKLDKIRDLFVFQCYTGQRFSDVKNLRWSDIVKNESGHLEWRLYQIKGDKPERIDIPLFDVPEQLLQKYGNKFGMDLPVFPTISIVKTNEYLKDVCELAEIDAPIKRVRYSGKTRKIEEGPKHQFVTTHCARRTFVTLSLKKGMSPEIVMSITGHSDYKTMRKYHKIFNDFKDREARKAWGQSELRIAN